MGSKKRSTSANKKTRRTQDPDSGGDGGGDGGSGEPPGYLGGYLGGGDDLDTSLQVEARRRYLNYALSVITSRALPDVRDGLKPVQRRILYAMSHDERLHPTAKHKKSAKVVGSVIGRYHPHGDTAVYDAMVRMSQDFAMRMPLVDGEGNFGSIDGDSAAAYRYTEARLAPPAQELLLELGDDTVDFRATYDGTATEPEVLPARFPNLLVNGCTGIAVGMATNIPPHNLREVVKALIALAEDPELGTAGLLKYIKGPDFPTGGQMLNDKAELRTIYEEGRGAIRVRGQYKLEPKKQRGGGDNIIITAVPYALNKSTLIEKIAEVIIARKLPQVLDVRDESTTDVRVVLELKKDVDPEMVMAYLFKHTPLQLNFNVNMTALVPMPHGPSQPRLLPIKEVLQHFLDFRHEVTTRRFKHALAVLQQRIHILEGFVIIFDALDETIRIIRHSDGKADAAGKLMQRFGLGKEQVEAILELRLYKLAKLEINIIREELTDKRAQARAIEAVLGDEAKLWDVIKGELQAVADEHGSPRKTKTGGEELEFDADAYILDEDADVVLTRDGWIKRLRELKDPSSTRLREGDQVAAVLPGSTKEHVVFFTNYGTAYVTKINDIPATTGYGQPVQTLFKFKDGERIVNAYTLDPRTLPPQQFLTISSNGYGQRFAMEPFNQPTTRAGRRFAKLSKGAEIVGVIGCADADSLIVATRGGHVLSCKVEEINKLENPGKGVIAIRVGDDDRVIGFISGQGRNDTLHLQTSKGTRTFDISVDARRLTLRGGKGQQLVKRSTLEVVAQPVALIPLQNTDGSKQVH